MRYTHHDSPLGTLRLVGDDAGLRRADFVDGKHVARLAADWVEDGEAFADVIPQLDAYFAGELTSFDLRLAPEGTRFQRRVWDQLLAIPCGETRSYGDLARRLGQPGASRAVGAANGRNPIAIIIPCHRVIAADGTLGGYSSGLDRKRWLLDHEHAPIAQGLFTA
ncbi:MAG: methylated-DNA--[protein]-cysteine S-methyltransferase [Phycisphaera sp.]|nr:methylated-DNA--[protein]-cysteine S-methyltransferase [Phycisphaera sp.]